MFGFGKNKTDKQAKKKAKKASGCEGKTKDSQRLREEALANVRDARAHIGEETLDKIAAAMTRKQHSAFERAKADINAQDPDKVLDEVLFMLKNRDA